MKIINIIILSIIITSILYFIPNKSNFSKIYIIPIITALLVKYIYGDLDTNYQWSLSDIYYWLMILFTSVINIKILKMLKL